MKQPSNAKPKLAQPGAIWIEGFGMVTPRAPAGFADRRYESVEDVMEAWEARSRRRAH